MATVSLPRDFKEFLQLLNEYQIRYLLVGGYAVGYHGYPRTTADIDLWVDVSPKNAKKIVDAIKEFGFDVKGLPADIFLQKNKIIRMGVPPVMIKIITGASGVEFEECFESRIHDFLDGVEINIINLDSLKANKTASGRHKDLDDLENLP